MFLFFLFFLSSVLVSTILSPFGMKEMRGKEEGGEEKDVYSERKESRKNHLDLVEYKGKK